MLKIQELREIITLIDQSSINEFNFEQDGSTVSIKKAAPQQTEAKMGSVSVQQEIVRIPVEEKPEVVTKTVASEKVEDVSTEAVKEENVEEITSPMVGTFYSKPTPESNTYVELGAKIEADSIVGIVEAMKLFNEIEAEITGEVVEILVQDGELVEYGQPLFKVKTK